MVQRHITINGKIVAIKPINFSAICDLEELGFSVAGMKDKTFSSIRAAVAYNMGTTLDLAGTEIENHIKNGGKLTDFFSLIEAITESDFFQALTQNTEGKE